MLGKSYVLSVGKIKDIYEGLLALEVFAESKLSSTYSYRLGRLKDHLEPVFKAYVKAERALKAKLKTKDGKINSALYHEQHDALLEEEYEGIQIPEFLMSEFSEKTEENEFKLLVPQKLINALTFHIIDDLAERKGKQPIKDESPTPTPKKKVKSHPDPAGNEGALGENGITDVGYEGLAEHQEMNE